MLKIQYTEGVFWGENVMFKKIREFLFFKKKLKSPFNVQSGIHNGPIQAFTALCRTKIVAATVIQRQPVFLEIFFRFSPINLVSTKNFAKKPIAPLKHYPNPTFKAIKTMLHLSQ